MTNKQKQCLLAYLGYYVGNIDGIWGTLSETAMNAFKKDFKGFDTPNIPDNAPEKALKTKFFSTSSTLSKTAGVRS